MDEIIKEVKVPSEAGKRYKMMKKKVKTIYYVDNAEIISEDDKESPNLNYRKISGKI